MNPTVLIHALVRQSMVLVAALATAAGQRAQLAAIADHVFSDLVRELKEQGLGNKVIADMFGMALRTYHTRVARIAGSQTVQGESLWEAVLACLTDRGPLLRAEILSQFDQDDETIVRGVLRDLVASGLVYRTGRGDATTYRATDASERGAPGSDERGLYAVDFGDRDPNVEPPPSAYLSLGWDIDGTCTTADNISAGECVLPAYSSGSIDGPQGVDNTLGAILQRIRQTLPNWSSETTTEALQAGDMGLLFRVRGYNGEPNDDQVTVAVFGRAPFEATNGAGSVPQWDGTDVWPVSSDSVTDGSAPAPLESPAYEDTRGYVIDGRLVAVFPALSIPWRLPIASDSSWRLQMNLTRAALTCTIGFNEQQRGTLTNCTLGARWASDDLLRQMSQLSDPTSANGQTPLCTDNPFYATFKTQICSRTDVVEFPGIDRECDALSVGINVETRPVTLGDLWILDEILPRCPDATEPSNDSCAE